MKEYIAPEIEVESFEVANIIATSPEQGGDKYETPIG